MVTVHFKGPKSTYRTNRVVQQPPVSKFFHDLINSSLSDVWDRSFVASRPSVNIMDNESAYLIEVAAPGVKKEDFSISVENDILTISAGKERDETVSFAVRQFDYGNFTRRFKLNEEIDSTNISAEYRNGILKITLPKAEEGASVQKIDIA